MSRVEQFLLGGGHNRTAIHVGLVNNMLRSSVVPIVPDADILTLILQERRAAPARLVVRKQRVTRHRIR